MNKVTEKQTITQQTINLNSIDAEILKDALIESNFIEKVITLETLSDLVETSFTVDDFLIDNDSLDSKSEKSKLSCFFQGYYELCKEIHDSKRKVNDISSETLKEMVASSRVFDNIIDITELVDFYSAAILLIDSMIQDEITEPKEKSRIIALIGIYNAFLKVLISKLEQ